MAEASAHKLSYIKEDGIGTTPANPRFTALPDTRTTLALTKDLLETERLTGTRFPAEPRTGASLVGGEIPADLSYGAYDDFIASALQGSWVDASPGVSDEVTIEVATVPQTNTQAGDTFATTNGVVTVERIDAKGQEVHLKYDESGSISEYPINGLGSATIDGDLFEVTLYTDTEENATVKAGDDRLSFSILREFSDFAPGEEPFLLHAGCEVATWSLTATANALVQSSFTMFGLSLDGPNETAPTGTSYSPAIDSEPFDTFSGELKLDGDAVCLVTEVTINLNNGHAPKYTVGCEGSRTPSVGQSVIDGTLNLYFEDAQFYSKFVDEVSFSLEVTFSDSKNNQLTIYLPNLKIGSGTQPDVTGDGPVIIPVNYTAHYDDDLESHISVTRLAPVAV